MRARTYRTIFWALALAGFLGDQATKYRVFEWLYHPNSEGSTAVVQVTQQSHDGTVQVIEGSYQVIPGVFRLLSQFTGQHETGSGLLASLRAWKNDALPAVNHGALFGLGREHRALANGIFAGVSILAAVAIGYWGLRRLSSKDGLLSVALGLILAGTLGNLYDRLVYGGVRDFLHFYWFEWPVFNVADCCLVCGAGLLLIQAFWAHPDHQSKSIATTEKSLAEVAEVK
ncbi:MAG TPA: signal peptidase II [Gemmataceae bacterium]|nr:signal peptidase II [Gemmataceae bacterium]